MKPSVKEKTDDELLTHYGLAKGDVLTNLGVLLVGGTRDRASLGSAPIVQAIKYDEREREGREVELGRPRAVARRADRRHLERDPRLPRELRDARRHAPHEGAGVR